MIQSLWAVIFEFFSICLLLFYCFYPLYGIYSHKFSSVEIVFLYILEALLLFLTQIINDWVIKSAYLDQAAKNNFRTRQIAIGTGQLCLIIMALLIFKRFYDHNAFYQMSNNNSSVIIYLMKILWLPILSIIISYTNNLYSDYKQRNKIKIENNILFQWFWLIFIPLQAGMFLTYYFPNSIYFVKDELPVLYHLITHGTPQIELLIFIGLICMMKFSTELFYHKSENKYKTDKNNKPADNLDIGPHPLSTSVLVRDLCFIAFLLTTFMALSPMTMDKKAGVTGSMIFIALLGMMIIVFLFYYYDFPYRNYLKFDINNEKLIFYKIIFNRKIKEIEIAVSEIKDISIEYGVNKYRKIAVAYSIKTNQLNPIIIKFSLFSNLELYNIFLYLKEHYPDIKIALPQINKDTHFSHENLLQQSILL